MDSGAVDERQLSEVGAGCAARLLQARETPAEVVGGAEVQVAEQHQAQRLVLIDPSRITNVRPGASADARPASEVGAPRIVAGRVCDYVEALKRDKGPEIRVHGSPALIQTLLDHDLIDEFRIQTHPVVLRAGKRLFGDGAIPVALRLVDNSVFKTGVMINTYACARETEIGDFEEPTAAELERRRRLAAR